MEVTRVADAIGVHIVGRLPHGEGAGAYEVRMPDGSAAVLKIDAGDVLDFGSAFALTESLRARGYLVPAMLRQGEIDGVAYELTELVPGEPLQQLTGAHLPQVVALNELQRDIGLPGRSPWIAHMVASVLDGCDGSCELEAMRSQPVLLDRIQEIARHATDVAAPTGDVVHYDFSPYNILADGDRVTAVVDWQGATAGDAAFDLVTLAYYTYDFGLRDALLDHARARSDRQALELYAAHMVLRQVDWSLRHHDDTTVWWHRGIGEALLDALTS